MGWNLQQINRGGRTNGPAMRYSMFFSIFGDQQHFCYVDLSGFIWDSWHEGSTNSWNLQQINAGARTNGPPTGPFSHFSPFVSVFGDQQHFAYLDGNRIVWDAWYHGPTNSWNLQQINAGGRTNGPPARGGIDPAVCVSVFRDQQHFVYVDENGIIWDSWYDGPTSSWNLQQINAGGLTGGPPSTLGYLYPFVSVFGDQQHFTYSDADRIIWDAWYNGPTNSWNLQQINAGGRTNAPLAVMGCPFVSVFGDQQHFVTLDENSTIWDSWYDGSNNSWNLQQINKGGLTNGPEADPGNPFVSVFRHQQHFAYENNGTIWDAWYDGSSNSWNLQQINAGGRTNGPPGSWPFISVFRDQQHFAYFGYDGTVYDAWYRD